MFDLPVQLERSFPPELATVLLAMLPVGELRVALPTALVYYQLPLAPAIFWSIVGNMLPVYFLLIFFERVSNYLRANYAWANRLLNWLFERTRRKLDGRVKKYGPWALALFVAVPLPITGAWTGTLAAFVFGLPKQKSFWAILLGICMSAAAVAFLTLGTSLAARGVLSL